MSNSVASRFQTHDSLHMSGVEASRPSDIAKIGFRLNYWVSLRFSLTLNFAQCFQPLLKTVLQPFGELFSSYKLST